MSKQKLTIVYGCHCEDLIHETEYKARMCPECPPRMYVLCPACREPRPSEEAALSCAAHHEETEGK